MSDANDKDAGKPTGGDTAQSGAETGTEGEYLKPEAEKSERKGRRRKEPRTIDATAEEVREEQAPNPGAGEMPQGTDAPGPSAAAGILVAGAAGLGGALVVLAGVWASGILSNDQDGVVRSDFDARLETLESGTGDSVSSLTERLDELTGRLDKVEQGAAAAAETPESAAAITERLEALAAETQQLKNALNDTRTTARSMQERLDEMSAALPPAGIAEQIGSLDALVRALDLRLASLAPKIEEMETRVVALEEKKDDPDAAARAALGLALANLARAAETPGPFLAELNAVAAFLPEEPALQELAPAAAEGVPTRAALEARFSSLSQNIFEAERRAGEDGVWSRFVSNAKSLVTVRRTGEISGDTTEAVVARMEERLKVNDLAGAVAEAKQLQGAAAEAAAPWIADAEARLQADALVRDLSARVAGQLAQTKG
ncbi:conserved hypothetical protein [Parvibaculum lavamentivorans DS-1]|uniref:Mitochondrial inner membrane protein n=1 Tax=Parvibaculum lavamentivorans (strain DS-1 / DSM 13023 / NCIMB 13966) TaxID=402881 RepID=A7HST8_PARL1|nr:mitofilin family membrane protein [Parvibaculum lavamentivorans]ABS62971.1 conserved hypothetical protein [Parvibaculum lavamentivorans DS-1]